MNTSPPDRPPLFPKLAGLVAAAHREPGSAAGWGAHGEAIQAYARELLPAVLGGSWELAGPNCYNLRGAVYDRGVVLQRRGARDHRAVVAQPYDDVISDGRLDGEAQALAGKAQGLWISRELSSWCPGRTVLVLVAAGLRPERAKAFGFQAVLRRYHRAA